MHRFPAPPRDGATFAALDPSRLDAQQIRRIVLAQCNIESAATTDLTVSGPVVANNFSRIFCGAGGNFVVPVAIKLFLDPPFGTGAGAAARTYYEALAALRATAGDPDFAVVEPLGIVEDHGIVITEWIDGPTFAAWVARLSPHDAARAARKAGLWLARLQTATGLTRRPMDTAAPLDRLRIALAANPPLAAGRLVREAAALLRGAAGQAGAEAVDWSRSHGDFKPVNLVVRDGRLFGIDLELLYRAPTVHDAAHFLNHLHLRFLSPRGLGRLPEIGALTAAFRYGYAESVETALPHLPLAWERLRNALHLLLRHREWASPPRSWIAEPGLRWLIYRLGRELAGLVR